MPDKNLQVSAVQMLRLKKKALRKWPLIALALLQYSEAEDDQQKITHISMPLLYSFSIFFHHKCWREQIQVRANPLYYLLISQSYVYFCSVTCTFTVAVTSGCNLTGTFV